MKRQARKKTFFILLFMLVGLTATMTGIILYSEWRLAKLVPGGLGERFPTKVYSSPFVIKNGATLSPDELFERLRRLDYRSSLTDNGPTFQPGQFYWRTPSLTLVLRGFDTPVFAQVTEVVKLKRTPNGEWNLFSSTGAVIDQIALEPELVTELSGSKKVRREPTPWEDFPPGLIDAVVSVEDRRFYKHHGVDPRAISRAAWYNLRTRRGLQGGSTITQQLAKNFFLTQDRTLQRKLVEVGFAVYLDLRYSKERILTLYLNHIYMGQDGVVSVMGMGAASQFYFGKSLRDLTLEENALLAGIIRSPYRYNPFVNPRAARERRNRVLKLMLEENAITEREFERAKSRPVVVRRRSTKSDDANADKDYFLAEVIRQLVPEFSEDILFRYGLKIYTTLDPLKQREAQRVARQQRYQSAIVVMEPQTGRILALNGGKDFKESQFNRASQAHRQPGSAFKPFVFGAALENGFTPASMLVDEPKAFRHGDEIWAPRNFDDNYHGNVSMRQALAQSMNAATLDLAQKIGSDRIIHFANKVGIDSLLEDSLALALGVSEVTPLELVNAYAPFANGGFRVRPYLIMAVVDSQENTLELNGTERTPVLDPALSYLMTSMLQSVISEGTAKGLKDSGWTVPSAGKTGTTNEGKDAWFVGYTSDLLVGVWVGEDDPKASDLSGSKNALPMWSALMKSYYAGRTGKDFEQPSGLTTVKIDPTNGLLARSGCPDQKEELFLTGTQPIAYCRVHSGGLKGWFQKLFRKR